MHNYETQYSSYLNKTLKSRKFYNDLTVFSRALSTCINTRMVVKFKIFIYIRSSTQPKIWYHTYFLTNWGILQVTLEMLWVITERLPGKCYVITPKGYSEIVIVYFQTVTQLDHTTGIVTINMLVEFWTFILQFRC